MFSVCSPWWHTRQEITALRTSNGLSYSVAWVPGQFTWRSWSPLSASIFICALWRFLAVTGPVKHFHSDRGTNFVGAVKELQIDSSDSEMKGFLQNQGCTWTFNTPYSSHIGVWERLIGIARHILEALLIKNSHKTQAWGLNNVNGGSHGHYEFPSLKPNFNSTFTSDALNSEGECCSSSSRKLWVRSPAQQSMASSPDVGGFILGAMKAGVLVYLANQKEMEREER